MHITQIKREIQNDMNQKLGTTPDPFMNHTTLF